jgi:hypothetical protein
LQRTLEALSSGQRFQPLEFVEQLLLDAGHVLLWMEAFEPQIPFVDEEVGW